MNIQDLVRQDYLTAVEMTERMAERFPAGSPERARWLHVAAVYAQATVDPVAGQTMARTESAPAQVTLSPGPQPS